MPLRAVIDTDIGDDIDDAFALALACLSPELEVVAVTTVYGQVHSRAQLAARLLGALGRDDIPVAAGSPNPLVGKGPATEPVYLEGLKGVEGRSASIAPLHAVDLLEKLVSAGEVDVLITIGPLTNAALLLLKRPDLASRVKLVSMAGAYTMNLAEYNVRCDPEAAAIVFSAGCEKVLVGLDVTLRCQMTQDMLRSLEKGGEEYMRVLSSYTRVWMAKSRHLPILHDPLAVAVAYAPHLVKLEPARVEVELAGRFTRGYTVVAGGEPNALFCRDVDAPRFLQLFAERVLKS
ncbi:MAG: nucleoside hydrolase [Thermofilaceae archaeon]